MLIHFLRHATFIIKLNGINLLVDPMLSRAEAMDPVQNAADQRRIPLIELPLDDTALRQLIEQVDAVLVTHLHRDHWDARAVEFLPQNIPLLCQPEDQTRLSQAGFTAVQPIASEFRWRDIIFNRTGGRHGTGEIGQKMGPVSGFILQAAGEPTLYIAGDTIWCEEVAQALRTHQPDVTMVNAGTAQFLTGDPITMTAEDVCQVCRAQPQARIIAVHMEAVNHCLLTRGQLRERLEQEGVSAQVIIPVDGELIEF
ncbi:MAG TPA: MBL fold metallo-hydrolase [Anaerolineae bacterium]|nr:MBL fold metallo-hydrolase [Anaerolineae bacterium]